jgi:hypothetical protein
MLKLATCSLAALITIASLPQARAWEANPEPGYCAQFFTNIDCNTIGTDPPGKGPIAEPEDPVQAAPVVPPKPEKKRKSKSAAAPHQEKQLPAGAAPAVSR